MQEYPITIHQHSGCGLPPRILLQIRILRFFTLRNREEIHLIIPTSFFYLTFIRISIIPILRNLHFNNVLEMFITLLPTAYIPKTMSFKGQFYHTFILIFLPESIIGHPLRESGHSGTCTDYFDSIYSRSCKFTVRCIRTTQILIYSFRIIQIELSKTERNP